MGHSLKKGPFVDEHLMKKSWKLRLTTKKKKKVIKLDHVVQRSSSFIGCTICGCQTDSSCTTVYIKKAW